MPSCLPYQNVTAFVLKVYRVLSSRYRLETKLRQLLMTPSRKPDDYARFARPVSLKRCKSIARGALWGTPWLEGAAILFLSLGTARVWGIVGEGTWRRKRRPG